MKKLILLLSTTLLASLFAEAQPTLTYLNHYQLTPNDEDTMGVFCRVFYHPTRDKFYTIYAGRDSASSAPQGQMGFFAWREYDANFVFTGLHDTLTNHSSAGDFAMVQVGTDYYHLTSGPVGKYKLSKYNEDFVLDHDTLITLDDNDSNTDQLMNYANGRLIIGAFHEPSEVYPSFPMQNAWTPTMHKFEFDLNLQPVAPETYLSPTFYSWGGSCIFNDNKYTIVSIDSFPQFHLTAFEYDVNWNYLGNATLNTDGQWSQGILWDGNYYYVAYHTGNQHWAGNVTVSIYDVNWTEVFTTTITNNITYPMPPGTDGENAQRPFLCRVGDKLYISYDQSTFTFVAMPENFIADMNWQSHVMVYQIDDPNGIENADQDLFKVYPNPANNFVKIECIKSSSISVTLFDINGRLILESFESEISIENLEVGTYFLIITDDLGNIEREKLIVN